MEKPTSVCTFNLSFNVDNMKKFYSCFTESDYPLSAGSGHLPSETETDCSVSSKRVVKVHV